MSIIGKWKIVVFVHCVVVSSMFSVLIEMKVVTLCVVLVLQDLKDYVRQAGEVTFADAHKQRKNEGYVYSQFDVI